LNSCNIGGRLTRDVEVRTANSGTTIANVGLAISNRRKKGEQWIDDPVFIEVTVFGKRGEALASHFKKGDGIYFPNCKLNFDSWETDAGKRSKISLIAFDWEFPLTVPSGGSRVVEESSVSDTPF